MSERHASSAAALPTRSELARRVSVLLPLPLGGAYDYRLPDDMDLSPGDFVVVPLGTREVIGVVWDAGLGEVADAKLKPIAEKLDAPPLCAVLRMAMSVPDALSPPRPILVRAMTAAGRHALERGDARELTLTRRRVLEAARDALPMAAKDLARLGACGTGVVAGLERLGWLEKVAAAPRFDSAPPDWRHRGPQLSREQGEAAEALVAAVRQADFSVTLIDGV